MKQLTKVALLLGVFFLGCAAERLVVPPARAGSTATRWEYICKQMDGGDQNITMMANQLGAEGWELAATGAGGMTGTNVTWCFERPLP
jgi:hypothetical protein